MEEEDASNDGRISKDQYFIEIAHIVAKRSTCIRRHVGAVLVKDSHIISTGYNGAPAGMKHCTKETCLRTIYNVPSGQKHELCRGVHAEVNCIIQAALHGTAISGNTTLYTTTFPCMSCLKVLANANIKRIVYSGEYFMENEAKKQLAEETGMIFIKI